MAYNSKKYRTPFPPAEVDKVKAINAQIDKLNAAIYELRGNPVTRAVDYIRESIHTTTPLDKISHYRIEEPFSIALREAKESALPSTILFNVPFPDQASSGQYLPSYEKQPFPAAPLHLYPKQKKKAPRRRVQRPVNKYRPRYRKRKTLLY